MKMNASRLQNVVHHLLIAAFVLLCVASSPSISETLDESLHWHYGLSVLQGNPERIDDSSMPVSALNMLPYYAGSLLPDGALKSILQRTFIARLVTILFSAAVASLIFHWSNRLYGLAAAVFSTLLYSLDPNVLANSTLITTDVFAAGMIALAFYQLWKFANSRQLVDGLLCAVIFGGSQLVKYTSVAIYPFGLLALIIHDWPSILAAWSATGIRGLSRYLRQLAIYAGVVILVGILVINIGFVFYKSLVPFGDYRLASDLFRSVQSDVPALARVPVPTPYPFLQGLDLMIHTNQTADRYGNVYLLGRTSKPEGFRGYYFVASALKVPIGSQIFILAALILYLAIPARRAHFFRDGVFMLVPFLLFTIYFNFFFNAQTGMRYYLVVFPLLYVLVGSLFVDWQTLSMSLKASSIALAVYVAVSVLSYFPYFTPYFNEFVWDKTQTYKYLADSNLDWGQSRGIMEGYLATHPDAVYEPDSVQPGLIVIAGSDLVGILTEPGKFAWLRDNFKPVDTIAYCYFVYDISPQQVSQLCASTGYCK